MFRAPLLDAPAKAVDLFMIVSGFLMMYHYRQRETGQPWESPATWRSFWLRRYFRIAPVYYLLLTVGLVFGRAFFTLHSEFLPGPGRAQPTGAPALDAVLHFTFLFGLFPSHCATTPIPDWSIALEMQFYALFPFLALAMRRLGPLAMAMIAALVTVISTRFLWQIYDVDHPKLLGAFEQPSLILLKIGLFFIGMIGAEAMALKKRGHPAAVSTGIVALVLAAVVASKLVTAMAAVLLILAFSATGRLPAGEKFFGGLRCFLGSKFSGFLAARSYSLYLSHTLVLFATGVWLNRWPWFAAASPFPRFAVLSAACAAILLPVTWLLFVGVEIPGIELGKRWSRARPGTEPGIAFRSQPMKTPVAFLVFNRPDCTARTLAAIREAKPPRLLVVADGPRQHRPEDQEKCALVRQLIADGVDWPCEVECEYAKQNLGCAVRVASGLAWAFSRAERLVVIEDDCLPDPSFFWFCDEMLEKYADDTRVGQICGTPFIRNKVECATSYVFSRYGPIWGWASWSRAWKYYDLTMGTWPRLKQNGNLSSVISNGVERRFRKKLYDELQGGRSGTWDFQWGYAKLTNSLLSVIPAVSLIENIGFGQDSTHTSTGQSILQRHELSKPLVHPENVIPDGAFEEAFSVASCGGRLKKAAARLLHTINRTFAGEEKCACSIDYPRNCTFFPCVGGGSYFQRGA